PLSGSILDPQSLNHYSYVENDPINASDPSGLVAISPTFSPIFLDGGVDPFANWNEFGLFDIPTGGPNSVFIDGVCVGCTNSLDLGALIGNPLDSILGPNTPPNPPPPQTQAQNNACTQPILNAVNNQFGTNFTPDNIQGDPVLHPSKTGHLRRVG
ncbi:MAG: hypothetical protein WA879_05530, partial [Candidatus Acidiferrales bacterium]